MSQLENKGACNMVFNSHKESHVKTKEAWGIKIQLKNTLKYTLKLNVQSYELIAIDIDNDIDINIKTKI